MAEVRGQEDTRTEWSASRHVALGASGPDLRTQRPRAPAARAQPTPLPQSFPPEQALGTSQRPLHGHTVPSCGLSPRTPDGWGTALPTWLGPAGEAGQRTRAGSPAGKALNHSKLRPCPLQLTLEESKDSGASPGHGAWDTSQLSHLRQPAPQGPQKAPAPMGSTPHGPGEDGRDWEQLRPPATRIASARLPQMPVPVRPGRTVRQACPRPPARAPHRLSQRAPRPQP